jgi:hypothetical protein
MPPSSIALNDFSSIAMKPVKLSRQILSVGLLALAISLGYFAAQSPVDALPTPPDGGGGRPTNRGSSGSHVVLPPPPNQGAPGQRSSSTSRGDCLPQQLDLTALVPAIQTENEDGFWGTHVFGQTTAASPTLWFHISESVADATLEFVLQDDDDRVFQLKSYPIEIPPVGRNDITPVMLSAAKRSRNIPHSDWTIIFPDYS